jgi:putative ABC transport system permease protein
MHKTIIHASRLALRNLAGARGSVAVAILTLGIGLSAAVLLLGVLDGAVRSLPVPRGNDIVEVRLRNARADRVQAPVPLEGWAPGAAVEAAGAIAQYRATLVPRGAPAARTTGAAMHASVLPLLGVRPALGRLPGPDPADADALVLRWELWQQFGPDEVPLGAAIDVDGRPHTLVGVMPPGFGFPENQSFWTVLPAEESGEIVARLAPGVHADVARGALVARLAALDAASGTTAGGSISVELKPWTLSRDADGGESAIFAGLGVLVLLLLVVCAANVAILLLVRATERAGQLAVHAALGASRARVAGQLLAEAAIVTAAGGLLGLAGGFLALRWMQLNLASHWGYFWMRMEVRPHVVLATFAVVIVTALLAGTAPAVRASRVDLARVLVGGSRGGHDPRQRRLGRWFVGVQVTLSTLGLAAAAFLTWGFFDIGRTTSLLPVDQVAVATITLPGGSQHDPLVRVALNEALARELARLPGATAASVASALPGGAGAATGIARHGDDPAAPPPTVQWLAADAGLLGVYDQRLLSGRGFDAAEIAGGADVVLVTAAFAERRLDGTAIGSHLRLRGVHGDDRWAEVVGVVSDWFPGRDGRGEERVIVPLAATTPARLALAVRTDGDATALLPAIRAAVAAIDPQLPVEELQTLRARMDWLLRMPRVLAAFGMIGGFASALVAAIGLYGVISFQVRTRTREIGIRMAVGAGARRIMREVIRESLVRVAPGLAVGLAIGIAGGRLATSATGGASGGPPPGLLFACVAAGMAAIGVLAGLEPALRAARTEPQDVLKDG